ncbi:hypothetical protein QYE76_047603 [Lolium multiflorum]|uniref:CASP-like protein n=1 Tax=Lolium multiflorum TaxID=4521 RepID=A0AAD8TQ75_LOLMU|nr:hypothetical protein QYE76_047603 [Lolium multiflorum]
MVSSKAVLPSVVLVLRLLALGLLAGSIALIVTDKVKVNSVFLVGGNFTLSFKDVYSYRYVLGIAAVGCAYTLLHIPLAAITIATRKRLIGGKANVALFLICADLVFAIAFATGAGACFGVSYDLKRYTDEVHDTLDSATKARSDIIEIYHDLDRFYVHGYAAASLMLAAAKCIAVVIVISVYAIVK